MISIPFLKKLGRQDCIGLDWGAEELKWVKLQTASTGRHQLVFLDCFKRMEEEVVFGTQLKEFVLKHGLTGTPTAVSLQDESLHIRRLELPRMPAEDLKEAIRWQMRDIAEKSMDDYVVRYSILEEVTLPEIVRVTLLGYAIKKSVVDSQIQLLQKVGLKPFFIEPASVSLAYAMERAHPSAEKEWVGCVDIGWKRVSFLATGNGKLHFVKSLEGVALQQAEELKENFPQRLALEIQHAIDAFSIAYQVEKVEKIFLAGGGAGSENLPLALSKNLGIATEVLNPFQGIEEVTQYSLGIEKPHLFGAAVGLAFLRP